MKFSFIHAEKASFSVTALCRVFGVTRQGYYAYARRPKSTRRVQDEALADRVTSIHASSRGTYGSPRITAALRAEGVAVGKRRVERTMRALGVCGDPPRRTRTTTKANPAHQVEENVLARDFTASAPNQRWVVTAARSPSSRSLAS